MSHLLFDNPAPIFLLGFALSFVLIEKLFKPTGDRLLAFSAVCGFISIAAYALINILNINRAGLLWHDEANILSIAAAYVRGQQMYHAVDSSSLYSLFYGPSTFLVYAPFFAIFSNPVTAIRLGILIVNLLNLFLLFTLLRTRLSRSAALALLPVGVAFLLTYTDVLLGNRGDDWLLLCLLLAAGSALKHRPFDWRIAALFCGIFSGLAINFKATIVPVVCLLIVILYRRYGFRAALLSASSCAASAVAIFFLPRIAFSNYLAWLVISSHQVFLKSTAIGNLVAAAFLLAPIVFLITMGDPLRRPRNFGVLIPASAALALLVSIVTGSKSSAGAWHLWPMLPFLLLGAAYEVSLRSETCCTQPASAPTSASRTLSILASIAIAATAASLYFAMRDLHAVRPPGDQAFRAKEAAAQQELESIINQNQNLVMGEGAAVTDYRTDLRYRLPLAGQEYFFDENAVVEADKAGANLSTAATARILGCGSIWIIPHSESPFSATRAGLLPITTTPFVFPDTLRLHFTDTHAVFRKGTVYDLWKCPSDTAQPPSK